MAKHGSQVKRRVMVAVLQSDICPHLVHQENQIVISKCSGLLDCSGVRHPLESAVDIHLALGQQQEGQLHKIKPCSCQECLTPNVVH